MNNATTTARKCFECSNLSIQDSFKLNKDTGMNVCKKRADPVTLNWNRPCQDYAPAPQQTILGYADYRVEGVSS